MGKPVRAALYARVSTSGHGQDVGLQLDELRQVAAQRGWVATEFVDEGVSGSKDSRPALDRMMADAHAGRLDVVAVWRFDRFARDTRHLLTAMEEFRALGVSFVSLREQIAQLAEIGVTDLNAVLVHETQAQYQRTLDFLAGELTGGAVK